MSLTIAYGALLTGVLVWCLLVKKLRAGSWEVRFPSGGMQDRAAEKFASARVGLVVFLIVVSSLFGLFLTAYFMRMGRGHEVASDWRPFPEPIILWINTVLLILSSIAMQWTRESLTKGNMQRTRTALIVGGVLAVAFLVGQFLAWRLLKISGYLVLSNPAVAFFYVLTGVHGLHLIGGMVVLGRAARRMWAKGRELIDVRLTVELTTVYWHYLLIVWLVLFGVLLSTSIDHNTVFQRLC